MAASSQGAPPTTMKMTVGSIKQEASRLSQDSRRKAANAAKQKQGEKKDVKMKSPEPPKRLGSNPKGQEEVLILVDCLEEEAA